MALVETNVKDYRNNSIGRAVILCYRVMSRQTVYFHHDVHSSLVDPKFCRVYPFMGRGATRPLLLVGIAKINLNKLKFVDDYQGHPKSPR